jgi:hypothetical protein
MEARVNTLDVVCLALLVALLAACPVVLLKVFSFGQRWVRFSQEYKDALRRELRTWSLVLGVVVVAVFLIAIGIMSFTGHGMLFWLGLLCVILIAAAVVGLLALRAVDNLPEDD